MRMVLSSWLGAAWLLGAMGMAGVAMPAWGQAAVATSAAGPSLNPQLAPTVKVHRSTAGEMDASGWADAKSTDGAYSVRLPMKFNDITLVSNDPSAPVERIAVIIGQGVDNIKFTATRIVYRQAHEGPQNFRLVASGKGGLSQKPDEMKALHYKGYQAVDITAKQGTVQLFQRILLVGNDLLTLTVEAPQAQLQKVSPLVSMYFQSLEASAHR